MKALIFCFLLFITIGCQLDPAEQTKDNFDMIITNTNIIDGTGNPMQSGLFVGIKNGKIVAIDSALADTNAEIIDGTNKYLIPGLFDCHVHTGNYQRDFPRLIHYGITSVFIPGGNKCDNEYFQAMRDLGNQDSIPAPKVFHTSQHFSMEGRHPAKTYPEGNWRDGKSIFYLKDTLQIEKLVKQVAQYPILGIKLTIEDGPAPPFVRRMPQAFINKTVSEAAKQGLEVFAHVSDNIELAMAIKGGVQNLVHFTGVNVDPQDSAHRQLIQIFKERDPSWVTTLMIDKSFLYPMHPEWFEAEAMLPAYQSFDSTLTDNLVERAKFYAELLREEYNIPDTELITFMQHQVDDIKFLTEQGINMVLGTDAGNDFNFHGYSLHEEMQLLEMGGIDPMTIIKMGTLNAAKMMKADDELGSIEMGKSANLLLLEKNPLDAISNSLAINKVIKNGVVQQRILY